MIVNDYKRIYHPSLGKFVYKHMGSGLIVDNIFKPVEMIANKLLKPIAKKALKSGIESAGDKIGKKVVEKIAEKSGHLFIKDLQKKNPKSTKKQKGKNFDEILDGLVSEKQIPKQQDYNVLLNRMISGEGYKKKKKKKVSLI